MSIIKKEILVYNFEKQKGEHIIRDMEVYKGDSVLKSKTFEGLEVKLQEVFQA